MLRLKNEETHRTAHVSQGLLRPLHSAPSHADRKRSHNVTAELHRNTATLQEDKETPNKERDNNV